MNIREKPAVLLQGNNGLLYQAFTFSPQHPPSLLKLMQLMMTSRSAEFKCPSIHLRMKEEKKKYIENHETSCKLHKRQGERERELRLIQERLQNEEQQKGNKEERKAGEKKP